MEEGCFLPRFRRTMSELTKNARLTADTEHPDNLRNGMDRNNHTYGPDENGVFLPLGRPVTYTFDSAVAVANIHLALDSDLDRKTLPGDWCEKRHTMRANIVPESPTMTMPQTLLRAYRIEAKTESGDTVVLADEKCNLRQCINLPVQGSFTEITFVPTATWAETESDTVHVFSFDVR